MGFKSAVVLDSSDIEYLKELYQQLPSKYHPQDHNLYNIYKTNVGGTFDPRWSTIQEKLTSFHGEKTPMFNYFLDYRLGSYARMHQDNPATVVATAVTLIEKSDDLIGGDTVIKVIDSNNQSTKRIIPQQVGRTIYYDAATDHGVSQVVNGNRKVLITWFRK